MKAIYNEGEKGTIIRETDEIPEDVKPIAEERRARLIETLADADDEIVEIYLDEGTPTPDQLKAALRGGNHCSQNHTGNDGKRSC